MTCCDKDTKYFPTPLEAFKHGPKEKILYITCVAVDSKTPNYVAVVDVDPSSETYCQVGWSAHTVSFHCKNMRTYLLFVDN